MMKQLCGLAFVAAAAVLPLSSASAGTPLAVEVDRSEAMMLTADPASVIIGNPAIADISLNGRQIILHGHAFGETNLTVFDISGNKIVDFDITVTSNSANKLSMFVGSATMGVSRRTYSCAPNCEASMMVGDDSSWMEKVISDNRSKNDYATGVKTSDIVPKATNVVVANPQQ